MITARLTSWSSEPAAFYAGLLPVPRDSGRVSGNLHRPKRYNRRPRRVFSMAALSSIRASGPSGRLVDVLWALLRDGREFTPEMPPITAAA
jgi:hypothetical protein